MKEDVTTFVRERNTCEQNKIEQLLILGLLQPLEIPSQAWTHISMDFIEGFPNSE